MTATELCERCENPASVMVEEPAQYCDRIFCMEDAVSYVVETNNDDPLFDVASALAALDAMVVEGTAHILT